MFEALFLAGFMFLWALARGMRGCIVSHSKCPRLSQIAYVMDYLVLYFFFFVFFWITVGGALSKLPDSSWLDPDTCEQQFRDSYDVTRRLADDDPVLSDDADSGFLGSATSNDNLGSMASTSLKGLGTTTAASVMTTITSTVSAALTVVSTTMPTTSATKGTTRSSSTPAVIVVDSRPNLPSHVIDDTSLRHYPFVRYVSLLAPIPVAATWCICVWDTLKHTRKIWTSDGSSQAHDMAIQVIALPMVYGLLALSAVVRVWNVMANFHGEPPNEDGQSWEVRQELEIDMYEACYEVGDLYEAWAMHHFAVLALRIMNRAFSQEGLYLQRAGANVDTSSPVYEAWAGTLKRLHKSVRSLTMQGIWSFVVVCLIWASWGLSGPVLEKMLKEDSDVIKAMRANKSILRSFFYGMGCVASTAAICNILQIERAFHLELLHFKPFLKFWGTKVLVSIAFLQGLLFYLPFAPFNQMSDIQAKLTYSTLICYECLAISVVHLFAWNCDEVWYKEETEEAQSLTALESLDLHSIPSVPMVTEYGNTSTSDDLRTDDPPQILN